MKLLLECPDIRINTIKHAMISQLQSPSQGFEDVVKAHFYLKKDRILQVGYKSRSFRYPSLSYHVFFPLQYFLPILLCSFSKFI